MTLNEVAIPMELPPALLATTAILARGAESVRGVMNSEENRFTRALAELQRLAVGEKIAIAILGDLGAIRYGYPAATQDIDIAVAHPDLERLIAAAPRYGFKMQWQAPSGWHTLAHDDVEINVVPEGGKARNNSPTTIPGPAQLGVTQGLDYASLAGWMELKLSSGRQKDRAHLVEVMKQRAAEELDVVRNYLTRVHEQYVQTFDQLREEAREEKEQEDSRGGSA